VKVLGNGQVRRQLEVVADAFSDRERESLETLGVATGFVINAARQRNLLLSDTVVEITFRLDDHGDFFVAASGRYD
jgi:ribosomal protein L15